METLQVGKAGLAHIIHDGAWRNRAVATRARPPGRRADRVRVRPHRACEVERPLHDRGAKREYRMRF